MPAGPINRVTITPEEALKVAFANPDMSLTSLQKFLVERGEKIGRMTLARWSKKYEWVKQRAEAKTTIVHEAQQQAATALAAKMIPQVASLTEAAHEALTLALAAIKAKKEKPEEITISEACRLVDCSVAAMRAAELLAGRPDNRTEHMTREKARSLFDEMHNELEDALARSSVNYAVPSASDKPQAATASGNGATHPDGKNGDVTFGDLMNEVDGRPWQPPKH